MHRRNSGGADSKRPAADKTRVPYSDLDTNTGHSEQDRPCEREGDGQSSEGDDEYNDADDEDEDEDGILGDEDSPDFLTMAPAISRHLLHSRTEAYYATPEHVSLLSSGLQTVGTEAGRQSACKLGVAEGTSKARICSSGSERTNDSTNGGRISMTVEDGQTPTSQPPVGGQNNQHQQQADATTAANASTDTALEPLKAISDERGRRSSIAERRANPLVGRRPQIRIIAPPASIFTQSLHHAPSSDSDFNKQTLLLSGANRESRSILDTVPPNPRLGTKTNTPLARVGTPDARSRITSLQPLIDDHLEIQRSLHHTSLVSPPTGRPHTNYLRHLAAIPTYQQLRGDKSSSEKTGTNTTPLPSPLSGSGLRGLRHDSNDSLLFPIDPFERVHYNKTPSPTSSKHSFSPPHSPLKTNLYNHTTSQPENQPTSSEPLCLSPSSSMPAGILNPGVNTTGEASGRTLNPSFSTASHMADLRRPTPNLQLSALPRFHPAVYQAPSAVISPTRSRQREQRARAPAQAHSRHGSDAQQQLYQYQKEMIANAARAAPYGSSQPSRDTPKAPALHPCGSPGPATPLALEEQADYLTAGIVGTGSPKDLVDQLIRDERDRRGGLNSGSSSPAISPAGGRG